MDRVLVIKQGSFGDIIVASGAIQDIREHHTGAEITILTGPAYRALFGRCPLVDRVLVDARAPRWRLDLLLALYRDVGFDGYGMIYDLQKSGRTAFYHRWLVRHAAWSGRASGCSHPYVVPASAKLTGQQEFALQLQAAGVPTRNTIDPDVSWLTEDVTGVLDRAGVGTPYIVLLPGASARHVDKCWPWYDRLAAALIGYGYAVVTVPGPAELELCRTMPGTMLTGDGAYLDFFQLGGVLRDAAFVVGNDSGPTHLAAHLGRPGLALFGSASSRYLHNMQRRNLSCLARQDIADITVEEVASKVRQAVPV